MALALRLEVLLLGYTLYTRQFECAGLLVCGHVSAQALSFWLAFALEFRNSKVHPGQGGIAGSVLVMTEDPGGSYREPVSLVTKCIY